jgi:kynurenine formamidase
VSALHLDAAWVAEQCRALSNWGRWGDDDELGAWNLVTADKVATAARCVRRGKIFSLALPFGPGGPGDKARAGRGNATLFVSMSGTDIETGALDRMHPGSGKFTEDWVTMNLSSSTQWDGFAHAFHNGLGYNGTPAATVTSQGARRNSITALADRIVTRAIVLDLPRCFDIDWLEPGFAIQPEDLDSAVAAQCVEVDTGDVVLVRTGQLAQVRAEGDWGNYSGLGPAPGLGARCGTWLADRNVAAVASDTWGLEVFPYETPDTIGPLHQIILAYCGISIGEMFDLEALAADSAETGDYDCMFVAAPLPIKRAINSAVNPIAIR